MTPRRRAQLLVAAAVAALLLAVATVGPVAVRQVTDDVPARTGPPTLDAVQVYEGLRNDHTEGDVHYDQSPPVGGPHDPVWLDCGAYDEPLRDENAVHDLEHGATWISYAPDLPAREVAALEGVLPDNGIVAPYDGLPAPVVVTVWGHQLALTGADDPRLALFLHRFSDGHTAPEPMSSCHGGVHDAGGVRTADV